MSGSAMAMVALAALAAVLAAGIWYLWRTSLQLCPHCGWIVARVQHGWRRCPRCHKQYARQVRRRLH